ncbi:MAG TPA: HEAT repeat domain-containing protein, partial [Anaerolineae bacterium]
EPVVTALQATFANTGESIEVRRHAVEALGFRSSPEIDQIVQRAYAQPDERMRVSAVFAMGRSVDDQWGEIVLKEMDAHDPEMRFEAARAAGEIEYAPAVNPLIRLIEDVDDDVQRAAVWSLGQIGGDKARQVLTAILESDAEYLHEIAEDALDELEFNSGSHTLGMLDFEEDDEEWVLDADDEEEDEDEAEDEDWAH